MPTRTAADIAIRSMELDNGCPAGFFKATEVQKDALNTAFGRMEADGLVLNEDTIDDIVNAETDVEDIFNSKYINANGYKEVIRILNDIFNAEPDDGSITVLATEELE